MLVHLSFIPYPSTVVTRKSNTVKRSSTSDVTYIERITKHNMGRHSLGCKFDSIIMEYSFSRSPWSSPTAGNNFLIQKRSDTKVQDYALIVNLYETVKLVVRCLIYQSV